MFQAATIAKELLDAGTSPTAVQLAKKAGSSLPAPLPKLPTSGQGVSSKEQLAYLSQVFSSSGANILPNYGHIGLGKILGFQGGIDKERKQEEKSKKKIG